MAIVHRERRAGDVASGVGGQKEFRAGDLEGGWRRGPWGSPRRPRAPVSEDRRAVAAAMPDVAPLTSTAFPLNVMAPPIAAGGAADMAAERDVGAPAPEIRRFGPAWASFESSGPIVQVDRICLNSRHYLVA